jgi:hypothetical protein
MLSRLALVLFAFSASSAYAQTVSEKAISECQSIDSSYTSVKDCLPETDVALTMLATVQTPELYGDDGATIVRACQEQNQTSVSVWACTRTAISDAVELLEMVGTAEKIADPRFKGVSDPELFARLEAIGKEQRGRFDRMFWGGSTYHPMK